MFLRLNATGKLTNDGLGGESRAKRFAHARWNHCRSACAPVDSILGGQPQHFARSHSEVCHDRHFLCGSRSHLAEAPFPGRRSARTQLSPSSLRRGSRRAALGMPFHYSSTLPLWGPGTTGRSGTTELESLEFALLVFPCALCTLGRRKDLRQSTQGCCSGLLAVEN
jgi:hypothetical protein